jgi:hypothetical protein
MTIQRGTIEIFPRLIRLKLSALQKTRAPFLEVRGRNADLGTILFLGDGSRASGPRPVGFFVIR